MATNAEKIATLFNGSTQNQNQNQISPTFTLNKKGKAAVAKGAAAAQMGRLQAAEARRRKEEKAAKEAEKAAARRANFEVFKAEFAPATYLTIEGRVYHFPKTAINPRLFVENCVRMGLNPESFKLAATKPRKSAPVETPDFRVAFWQATRSIVNSRKKIVWFNLKTGAEVISAINPTSLGIWVDRD